MAGAAPTPLLLEKFWARCSLCGLRLAEAGETSVLAERQPGAKPKNTALSENQLTAVKIVDDEGNKARQQIRTHLERPRFSKATSAMKETAKLFDSWVYTGDVAKRTKTVFVTLSDGRKTYLSAGVKMFSAELKSFV